jgi:hypothetical protein
MLDLRQPRLLGSPLPQEVRKPANPIEVRVREEKPLRLAHPVREAPEANPDVFPQILSRVEPGAYWVCQFFRHKSLCLQVEDSSIN